MSDNALAARIDAIESREAVAGLIHAYARAVRQDRPEDVPALFAPDGWFEIRDGEPDKPDFSVRARLDSPEHIRVYLLSGKGKAHPIPLIHNLMVEVSGDVAQANCVMEATVYGTAHKVMGEYHDSFRRVGGQWRFASRTYTIFRGGSSV